MLFISNVFVNTIVNSCGFYHLLEDLPTRDSIGMYWTEKLFLQKEENYNTFHLGYCNGNLLYW